ncbi:aminotransferase class V-fold PLP-dependent enzyme [Sphingomonas sp. KRR8]|uniref:cysteine desulfurase family protein n=1 Tax=Sphingomonas sp. KRR8 TaxID=2942996 RepID=UPI00202196A5|nr:aminotransferase class V-fold PLP-dependent enzyme [Sphingomonas sp. KRR8]URD61664.1 aminotransferase class V-fold PLP-dependent enzyme [Sphingomonas sp. KRR8]
MTGQRIYLDHAATTRVLPEARVAVDDAMAQWANPSSPHADGRAARAMLERARSDVADALGWPHDVIFTSGASEALAIAGARATVRGRWHGATEHEAVPAAMGELSRVLPVTDNGLIDLAALGTALAEGPALVAIQQVNNETGVLQPLDEIADRVRAAGSLLLADCAQGAGKLRLPDADFIAVSAHKLGGPPGVGALLVKDLGTLAAMGGQERGYRRGTHNLPGIAGFAAALTTRAFADAMPRIVELRRQLEAALSTTIIASDTPRSPAIGAYAVEGVTSAALLVQLDLAGFAVSAGSACSSGSMKRSHVLTAMGVPPDVADSTIRISFGPSTTEGEVDAVAAAVRCIAKRARAA